MKSFKKLSAELHHYKSLPQYLRSMLLSYYFYSMAYPLIMLFTNTFLWRHGKDINSLIFFNLFYCLILPIGFYINGLLLSKFHALKLYALGAFLQALAGALVVIFSGSIAKNVWLFGALSGFGAGLFWSNKNYLDLLLTKNNFRLFYMSMGTSFRTLAGVFIPLMAGYFIVLGEKYNVYSTRSAYLVLMLIAVLLALLAGLSISRSQIQDLAKEKFFLKSRDKSWNNARVYHILVNLIIGLEFVLPSVLILSLLGDEDTLGLITSLSAIFGALVLYVFARKVSVKHAFWAVTTGTFLYISGAVILALFFNPTAVIFYMMLSTISWSIRWIPGFTLVMELADQHATTESKYAYICDNEIMFNIGRIAGLTLLFSFAAVSLEGALRFSALLLGLASTAGIYYLGKISKAVNS